MPLSVERTPSTDCVNQVAYFYAQMFQVYSYILVCNIHVSLTSEESQIQERRSAVATMTIVYIIILNLTDDRD